MLIKFQKFLDEFKGTKLWLDMEATCENSPWHREANVSIHTQMIIDHYLENFAPHRTPRQQILTLLSIVFHDTGKPAAKRDKHTEARGHYQSFGGHEQLSARIFEDYAVVNWNKWKQLKRTFDLKDTDLYLVMWVIENHLPHNFTKAESLQHICNQLHSEFFEYGELATVYYDQILCDQAGRISDAQEKNMDETIDFVDSIKTCTPWTICDKFVIEEKRNGPNSRKLVLMIGASGSGKSTYCDKLRASGYEYVSLDALRIEYGVQNGCAGKDDIDLYKNCYDYCDGHRSGFRHFADKKFRMIVEDYKNVVVDNTNVSRKSRATYITEAKKRGYQVISVLFPINKAKLVDRSKTRTDKKVPIVAVLDQYNRITMPWINPNSDADFIEIVMTNVDGQE